MKDRRQRRIFAVTRLAKLDFGWKGKLVIVLLAASLLPIFFISLTVFPTLSQTKSPRDKQYKKRSFANEPIQITEIRSNDRQVEINEIFRDDNWLEGFSVTVKNISRKTITFIYLSLDFPETESSGKRMVHSIRYGVPPTAKTYKSEDLRSLLPGGIDTIRLSPSSFAALQGLISQRLPFSEITIANISIERVEFSDGSHWGAGDTFVPDPARPGKFIVDKPTTSED